MNSSTMLAAFRDEVADQELPYLWSDTAAYRYIDDAQKMFCRLTEGIEDARSYTLAITPGTTWYTLDPVVLKVRDVSRADTGHEIPILSMEAARAQGVNFDLASGPIQLLVSGFEKDVLRAWPVPNETVSAALSVFRLPLDPITGPNQDLEIDDQHHEHLLLWMKHRAYDKQDAETFNKSKSAEFEQRFRTYCAAARVEQERRRRTTGAVAYGGL